MLTMLEAKKTSQLSVFAHSVPPIGHGELVELYGNEFKEAQ